MRLTHLIVAASVLALLTPVVAAHGSHSGCGGASKSVPAIARFHVDLYDGSGGCTGAAVWGDNVCMGGPHVHPDQVIVGVHVFALASYGCQTGVLV